MADGATLNSGGADNLGFSSGEEVFSLSVKQEENSVVEEKKPKEELSEEELRRETRRVWKSVIITCMSMSLIFSALVTLIGVITSLFPDGNLGISTLAVSGASQTIAAATLNPIVTKLWGARRMLHLSFFVTCLCLLAFFYPNWVTLMIGTALGGISISLLISTGFIYINTAGYWLVQLRKTDDMDVLTRISGLLNASYGCAFVWGNLALYYILDTPDLMEDESADQFPNLCGAAYCNQELNVSTLKPPSPERYYILVGLLQVFACVGCAIFFVADDFSSRLGHVGCTKREACRVFRTAWKLLKDPKGFLLVPITVFMGMEESFMFGDITKAVVSCSLGISMVGLVMVAFGVAGVVTCLSQWVLVQKFGRMVAAGLAIVTFLLFNVTILAWTPNPHDLPVYFVIACMWASADGLLASVVFGTYAVLYEEHLDEAFSIGIFWWSFGNLFWFTWSQFVCMTVKLYFTIVFAVVSFVLYFYLDRRMARSNSK